MNDNMNNTMELEVAEVIETCEKLDAPKRGKVIGLIAGTVVAVAVLSATVFRKKIEEHQIKRLEKKGYTVIRPETEDTVDCEVECDTQ